MNEKAGCAREGDRDGGTVEQKSGEFHSWQEFLSSGLCPSYLARPPGFNGGHYRCNAARVNGQVKKLSKITVLVQISENGTHKILSFRFPFVGFIWNFWGFCGQKKISTRLGFFHMDRY